MNSYIVLYITASVVIGYFFGMSRYKFAHGESAKNTFWIHDWRARLYFPMTRLTAKDSPLGMTFAKAYRYTIMDLDRSTPWPLDVTNSPCVLYVIGMIFIWPIIGICLTLFNLLALIIEGIQRLKRG